MKTKLIFLLILSSVIIFHSDCFSQAKKKKVYKAIIATNLQTKKMEGILQEVRDSSIIIVSNNKEVEIPSTAIQEIKIRRVGSVGRGALIGGLVGLGTGAIIGFVGGDEAGAPYFSAGEMAVIDGIALGMLGATIGALSGLSDKEKITINFDPYRFQNKKVIMKKYESSPPKTN
jgi:hypothetical protein